MSNYHTIQMTQVRQVVFTIFADTQEEALEIANDDYQIYDHDWDSTDVSIIAIGEEN